MSDNQAFNPASFSFCLQPAAGCNAFPNINVWHQFVGCVLNAPKQNILIH